MMAKRTAESQEFAAALTPNKKPKTTVDVETVRKRFAVNWVLRKNHPDAIAHIAAHELAMEIDPKQYASQDPRTLSAVEFRDSLKKQFRLLDLSGGKKFTFMRLMLSHRDEDPPHELIHIDMISRNWENEVKPLLMKQREKDLTIFFWVRLLGDSERALESKNFTKSSKGGDNKQQAQKDRGYTRTAKKKIDSVSKSLTIRSMVEDDKQRAQKDGGDEAIPRREPGPTPESTRKVDDTKKQIHKVGGDNKTPEKPALSIQTANAHPKHTAEAPKGPKYDVLFLEFKSGTDHRFWLNAETPFRDAADRVFITANQFIYYHQAVVYDLQHKAFDIWQATDVSTIIRLGRALTPSARQEEKWDRRFEEVLYHANYFKFARATNSGDIKNLLLSTGEKELVAAMIDDAVRGIGMGSDRAEERRDVWGMNLLGKALMRVRRDIRDEEPRLENQAVDDRRSTERKNGGKHRPDTAPTGCGDAEGRKVTFEKQPPTGPRNGPRSGRTDRRPLRMERF